MKQKIFNSLLLLFFVNLTFSQNVALDTSFGTNGKILFPTIGPQLIQLQSDGKILACYSSSYSTAGNIHIVRYNADGNIDSSFGINGKIDSILFTEIGGWTMMKLQPDGKILLTGDSNVTSSGRNFCTARYTSDGTLDATFGVNGYATTKFGGAASNGSASNTIAIQDDGKILVGGYGYPSSDLSASPDVAVVRYLSNGTIDTSFATNGKFIYNFGTRTIPNSGNLSADSAEVIKIDSNGRIIIGAITDVSESISMYNNFGFIRLNSNGSFDANFAVTGIKTVDLGAMDEIQDIHITSDNKIIAIGRYQLNNNGSPIATKIPIVKLLENGDFDASFGTNGIVLTNKDATFPHDSIFDSILQADGKLLCLGVTASNDLTNADILLVRFNANGSIDTTFNGNGFFNSDINSTDEVGYYMIIQSDGKILCSGGYSTGSSQSKSCFARFTLTDLATNTFENNTFSVYPNPFKDHISIDIKGMIMENALLELYDISGRKIMNLDKINSSNFEIPMNKNLSKGNYFLKITNENKTETFKIFKQ